MTQDEMAIAVLNSGDISVDADGRVWRHRRRKASGKLCEYPQPRRIDLKGKIGYFQVKLCYQGKTIRTSAHRLQWMKHHGPIPDHLEVNHKDRDKGNNRLDNLELLTHQANRAHAGILDWEKVRWIRANVGPGKMTQAAAAKRFGVTPVMICTILSGKYWKETA